MTVALSIHPKGLGPESARLVPVATHEVFRNDWMPASRELGLIWVPMFETGVPVSVDDIQDILAELHRLKGWIVEHQAGVASRIGDRITNLVSELEAMQQRQDVELYIG